MFAILAFGTIGGTVLTLAVPAYLVAMASCVVRRLHDRGKSGWWIVPFMLAPLPISGIALNMMHSRIAGLVLAGLGLWLAAVIVNIWGFIEIGVRRGPALENVFGAPA